MSWCGASRTLAGSARGRWRMRAAVAKDGSLSRTRDLSLVVESSAHMLRSPAVSFVARPRFCSFDGGTRPKPG